jgi:D-tyrosyl-tRNA(Tyr) deacylase
VKEAKIKIGDITYSSITQGIVVLLCVECSDTDKDTTYLVNKIVNLRIFDDKSGKLNRSIEDIRGEMMVVSQFTLSGDCRRGNRPSYTTAASPDMASKMYETFLALLRNTGVPVKSGKFGAYMKLYLCNDGPVTIIISTHHLHKKGKSGENTP